MVNTYWMHTIYWIAFVDMHYNMINVLLNMYFSWCLISVCCGEYCRLYCLCIEFNKRLWLKTAFDSFCTVLGIMSITKICRLVFMSVSLIQQCLSNTKNVCTLLWSPVVSLWCVKWKKTQSYEAYNCFNILSMILCYAFFDVDFFQIWHEM